MKKHIPLLAVSLLISLFIYVFYRTEKTLVNRAIIALISREGYYTLKTGVTVIFALPDWVIYSLPEGLWVFCITVTSSYFYLETKKHKWRLVFVPLLVAVIMEVLQLLHFINGRFDVMDITISFGFWLLALFCTRTNSGKEALFYSFNSNTVYCMISYSLVYFAHVIY